MKTINIRGIICGSELDNEFTVSYIERGIITPLSVFEREIADSNGDDLTIYINSQGGSVDAGMEMLSKIQDYKGNITIVVGALAASMAAEIVLLAGKRVEVHENTRVMFHSAYGVVEGGPEALKDYAKELEILNKPAKEKLVTLGVPKEEVEEGFSEGRMFWMGADDLLSYGIAQKVIDGAEAFDKPTDEEVKALAVQSARIAAYAFEPAQAEETTETAQTETEEPAQAQTAAPEAQAEEPAQTETAETVETAAPESASAQTEVPRISGLVEVEASLLERLRKSAEHSEENARKVQSAASKKIDTLNKILAELNEKMAAKDAEIEAAKLEKGSLENEINNFKQRLDSALADCDEKNNRIEALEKELGEKNLRVADLQTRVKDVIGNVCDSQEEECSDWLTALRRYGTAKALALYPDLAREFRAAMATRTKKN